MMWRFITVMWLSILMVSCQENAPMTNAKRSDAPARPDYAMAIHGGAGTISRATITPEQEQAYLEMLHTALTVGEEILKNGGTSLDAVEQTIMVMEDSPLFNAGRGAVFTHDEKNALDASIMDGKTLMAGAVGGITNIKHPITAARAVMEKSDHVFLTGAGAEQFAALHGIETVDPAYFYTERRWQSLQRVKAAEAEKARKLSEEDKHGTVGVAALDQFGNLAAGTSTGGMTNKRYGRIGDSPVIGAGTYANNATCAISSTGHGEFFIRYAVAHDISAMMEYKGIGIQEAAEAVIMSKLKKAGGTGGVIGVDKDGNIAMVFNTEGMYRAALTPNGRTVKIYQE